MKKIALYFISFIILALISVGAIASANVAPIDSFTDKEYVSVNAFENYYNLNYSGTFYYMNKLTLNLNINKVLNSYRYNYSEPFSTFNNQYLSEIYGVDNIGYATQTPTGIEEYNNFFIANNSYYFNNRTFMNSNGQLVYNQGAGTNYIFINAIPIMLFSNSLDTETSYFINSVEYIYMLLESYNITNSSSIYTDNNQYQRYMGALFSIKNPKTSTFNQPFLTLERLDKFNYLDMVYNDFYFGSPQNYYARIDLPISYTAYLVKNNRPINNDTAFFTFEYINDETLKSYAEGYRDGLKKGSEEGRAAGIKYAQEELIPQAVKDYENNVMRWAKSIINTVGSFLNIKLGKITIGDIVLIPVSLSMVYFIIKTWRGGQNG